MLTLQQMTTPAEVLRAAQTPGAAFLAKMRAAISLWTNMGTPRPPSWQAVSGAAAFGPMEETAFGLQVLIDLQTIMLSIHKQTICRLKHSLCMAVPPSLLRICCLQHCRYSPLCSEVVRTTLHTHRLPKHPPTPLKIGSLTCVCSRHLLPCLLPCKQAVNTPG